MCGFSGSLLSRESVASSCSKYINEISHRGNLQPTYLRIDGCDYLYDVSHVRLAIIDESNATQPMVSSCGRFSLLFNGEIHNYIELRQLLLEQGSFFFTNSDTEVILQAFLVFGESFVAKLNGMFSITIFDRVNAELFCYRDRFGIKPFYYSFSDENFHFSSEIKALLPVVGADLNLDGLQDYINLQFCMGTKTMFNKVLKLEPGTSLKVTLIRGKIRVTHNRYYSLSNEITSSKSSEDISSLMERSVAIRLRADVPICSFLSGGLDSSSICAIANKVSGIGQCYIGDYSRYGMEYSELEYARAAAEFNSLPLEVVNLDINHFDEVIPQLVHAMDEPCGGIGAISQFLLSKHVSKSYKVALGGQGGDEVFAGYARYFVMMLFCAINNKINGIVDKRSAISEDIWASFDVLSGYQGLWNKLQVSNGAFSEADAYYLLLNRYDSSSNIYSEELFNQNYNSKIEFVNRYESYSTNSMLDSMCLFDLNNTMQPLLQVDDRTSMLFGLETRLPLLDHEVVEAVFKHSTHQRLNGGVPKQILRAVVKDLLPDNVLKRRDKMGFPVPFDKWVNKTGREFINDNLRGGMLLKNGIININSVNKILDQNLKFDRQLWGVLNLELWYQQFLGK